MLGLLQVESLNSEDVRALQQQRARSLTRDWRTLCVIVFCVTCVSLVLVWQVAPTVGGRAGQSLRHSGPNAGSAGGQKNEQRFTAADAKNLVARFHPPIFNYHTARFTKQPGLSRSVPSVRSRTRETGYAPRMVGMQPADGSSAGRDGVFGFVGGVFKAPVPWNDERWLSMTRVFVLVFHGQSPDEDVVSGSEDVGIGTLRVDDVHGKEHEVLVVFEEFEDASRYAGLMEAQGSKLPCRAIEVVAVRPPEISPYIASQGMMSSFIPAGTLFLPPGKIVDGRGSLKQRYQLEAQFARSSSSSSLLARSSSSSSLLVPSGGGGADGPPPLPPPPPPLQGRWKDGVRQDLKEERDRLEALLGEDSSTSGNPPLPGISASDGAHEDMSEERVRLEALLRNDDESSTS